MSGTSKRTIAVIGGGAAGLLAAVTAADKGARVMVFEKMDRIGLKMGITGKGRCNLTNSCPIADFIGKTPGNGRFLYSAYRQFDNEDLIRLVNSWGIATVEERGGRIFPASQSAQEVRRVFLEKLKEKRVDLHLEEPARHILIEGGRAAGVVTGKGTYRADAVILATGGKSYPRTGSTGDGYAMAKEAGHTIVPLRPALIPLVCAETWCKDLQGLSLKNVNLTLRGGKKPVKAFGEMLFTHFGISGPIVLTLSDTASAWLMEGLPVTAAIDLKPALSEEMLDKRILRDLAKFHLKQMGNALLELLPHRLIPVVLSAADIPEDRLVSELTKKERRRLVVTLKGLTLSVTATRPIEEAIVTAGGVSTKEIRSSTMESKKVKDLYLAGEVIDIHAFTGGFNLQAAFSTGYAAAAAAAEGEDHA